MIIKIFIEKCIAMKKLHIIHSLIGNEGIIFVFGRILLERRVLFYWIVSHKSKCNFSLCHIREYIVGTYKEK